MSDFYTNVDKVFQSWNYSTPKALYGLVRCLKPSRVIEVGTYRGYGAAWMAKALQENNHGKLFVIDNFSLTDHSPTKEAMIDHLFDNLTKLGVRDFVTLIVGNSTEVEWPGSCDFAYIDGWHSYEVAKHDFDKCAFLGAECICLDDAEQSVGPRMVVEEARKSGHWDVVDVLRDCGMAICFRRRQKGPVTFSQEQLNHPGVDLQTLTKDEQLAHLQRCADQNGVDYSPALPWLHEGRRP